MTDRAKPFALIFWTAILLISCLVIWYAYSVFLLAFAAILLAIFFQSISEWLHEKIRLPYSLCLLCVIAFLVLFLVGIFWLFAPLINEQIKELMIALPKAYDQLKVKISSFIDLKKLTTENLFKSETFFSRAGSVFSFTFETIINFIIFIFVGIYLAFDPQRYLSGFLLLFPPRKRRQAEALIGDTGKALRFWILGKFIAMTIIGVLTTIGLWLINVPLAFILGLLAALLTFIPYLGPIIAAIPAVLIGLTQYPLKAVYVALLYMLIQSLEGYLITPYIDQKTVSIPPGLTIMAQVLLGVLAGFIGLALASPLVVVFIVLFRHLYASSK